MQFAEDLRSCAAEHVQHSRCRLLKHPITFQCAGSSLASAIAAAAALLGEGCNGDGMPPATQGAGSVGCATAVTLQFVSRPEWLQQGARLILRDRGDGCAAGAGIVRALHWGVAPAVEGIGTDGGGAWSGSSSRDGAATRGVGPNRAPDNIELKRVDSACPAAPWRWQ